MIACKTHIALGSSAQDTSKGHGALTSEELIADTRKVYGWPHGPFVIPADVKSAWEAIGSRGAAARDEWEARLEGVSSSKQAKFAREQSGEAPRKLSATIKALKKQISESDHARNLWRLGGFDRV